MIVVLLIGDADDKPEHFVRRGEVAPFAPRDEQPIPYFAVGGRADIRRVGHANDSFVKTLMLLSFGRVI